MLALPVDELAYQEKQHITSGYFRQISRMRSTVLCPPHMMNSLVRSLNEDRAQLLYSTDNSAPQSRLFCPCRVWRDVREGVRFVRKLQVKVQSPATMLDVKIQGLKGTSYSVSNCPRNVGGFMRGMHIRDESDDILEQELASLTT